MQQSCLQFNSDEERVNLGQGETSPYIQVYSSVAIVYQIYYIHHFREMFRGVLQTLEQRNVCFI